MSGGKNPQNRQRCNEPMIGKWPSAMGGGFFLASVAIAITLCPTLTAQQKPCCSVTGTDTRGGLVSAKVNATGEDFQFTLNNPALLGTLKIGQGVYANFQTKRISLDGQHVSGVIVSIGVRKGPLAHATPGQAPSTPPTPQPQTTPKVSGGSAPPGEPLSSLAETNTACCVITTIDVQARLVAAKDNSNGQTFQFSMPNSLPMQQLHVGQPVWANFNTRLVSVDGRVACCEVVSPGNTSPVPTSNPAGQRASAPPGAIGSVKGPIALLNQFKIQSLDVWSGPIPGGQNSGWNIVRLTASAGGTPVIVELSTDKPGVASVPASLSIQNAGGMPFVITTFGVASPIDVNISAHLQGSSEVVASKITVRPAQLSILACSPNELLTGTPAHCKVWLDGKVPVLSTTTRTQIRQTSQINGVTFPAPSQGAQIQITSDHPTVVPPLNVVVGAGNDLAEFDLPTIADSAGGHIKISASYQGLTQSSSVIVVGISADTGFNPHVHGFHFTNYFTGQILIDIPLIGTVDLGSTSYGLCGGMTYSALDNFIYEGTIPSDATPPVSSTPLRSYLYSRQIDTFTADNAWLIRRFIEWVAYPDTTTAGITGLDVLTFAEFQKNIQPQLAAGHPVTLGLVEATPQDLANLQDNAVVKNHQVLAIGYELHKDPVNGTHWDIRIYDPNFPDRIERMHTHSTIPGYEADELTGQQTGSFRGFFATPYSPKQPYWVLSGQANP